MERKKERTGTKTEEKVVGRRFKLHKKSLIS